MSNRVHLTPTEFKDMENGESSYGYIIRNDYGHFFNDCLSENPKNHLDLLRIVVKDADEDQGIYDLLQHLVENEIGLFISSHYYEWADVQEILTTKTTTKG
jgi:hypothetical protein